MVWGVLFCTIEEITSSTEERPVASRKRQRDDDVRRGKSSVSQNEYHMGIAFNQLYLAFFILYIND